MVLEVTFMTPKRKKVQDRILEIVNMVDKSGKNAKFYTDKFSKMSDKDFDDFMKRIRDHDDVLCIYCANMVDHLKVADVVKAAKKVNLEIFERIRMYDAATDSYYYTPNKFMVVQLPVRRLSQFADHKLSIPEGDSRIDMLTGQVVKPDQGAGLSEPEIRCLYAQGLKNTLRELVKFRGGDVVAFAEYKRELEENGQTTIDRDTGTKVRSSVTLDVYLSGMLIESNASGL